MAAYGLIASARECDFVLLYNHSKYQAVSNPYSHLSSCSFWKTGVAQENPYAIESIYCKKFEISATDKIVTAGSCFAQHISRYLNKNGYGLLDVEPPPPGLPEALHSTFGYLMYSARYGNIYTVRQLLQLAQEVAKIRDPKDYIWEQRNRFYDGLRPAVEPNGLRSSAEVVEHRSHHLSRLKDLFVSFDVFIFTLGLTESWVHRDSGTVYPLAPGALIGHYDESIHGFYNLSFSEILEDFLEFESTLQSLRNSLPYKIILTVSPVPLTATASGKHILVSNTYSKAVLRAVAGYLSDHYAHIDYFPSFEIVTNPRLHSSSYSHNLRSVRQESVDVVMKHFFEQHPPILCQDVNACSDTHHQESIGDLQCEEALLEAFSK